MRRILAPLLAALLLSVTAASRAQVPVADPPLIPRYEVEVIVFAHTSFDPSEERFDQTLGGFGGDATMALRDAPVFGDAGFPAPDPFGDPRPGDGLPQTAPPPDQVPLEPLPPVDPLVAARAEALRVRVLQPEELKLGGEYRRLTAIAAYRPLLHAGWVQPGLPEADSKAFDLKVIGAVNPSGTVRVHLSRFLHITLDLTYQATGAAPQLGGGDGLNEVMFAPRYRLNATRSARSGELHYFDHPAFGVLVRVTPVPTDTGERRPAA